MPIGTPFGIQTVDNYIQKRRDEKTEPAFLDAGFELRGLSLIEDKHRLRCELPLSGLMPYWLTGVLLGVCFPAALFVTFREDGVAEIVRRIGYYFTACTPIVIFFGWYSLAYAVFWRNYVQIDFRLKELKMVRWPLVVPPRIKSFDEIAEVRVDYLNKLFEEDRDDFTNLVRKPIGRLVVTTVGGEEIFLIDSANRDALEHVRSRLQKVLLTNPESQLP